MYLPTYSQSRQNNICKKICIKKWQKQSQQLVLLLTCILSFICNYMGLFHNNCNPFTLFCQLSKNQVDITLNKLGMKRKNTNSIVEKSSVVMRERRSGRKTGYSVATVHQCQPRFGTMPCKKRQLPPLLSGVSIIQYHHDIQDDLLFILHTFLFIVA